MRSPKTEQKNNNNNDNNNKKLPACDTKQVYRFHAFDNCFPKCVCVMYDGPFSWTSRDTTG